MASNNLHAGPAAMPWPMPPPPSAGTAPHGGAGLFRRHGSGAGDRIPARGHSQPHASCNRSRDRTGSVHLRPRLAGQPPRGRASEMEWEEQLEDLRTQIRHLTNQVANHSGAEGFGDTLNDFLVNIHAKILEDVVGGRPRVILKPRPDICAHSW